MRHDEFWHLFCLVNTDPKNVGGHNNLILVVQYQGISKKDGYTPTTTVSEKLKKENKRQ